MNAAFLLVTTALLVGQGGDKKPAPPPAAPAAVASSCGQDNCGCDGFGHRLRDKLRGLFNRNSCDSCQPTTCQTSHCAPTPIFKSSCEDACKPKWHIQHTHTSCAPATCTDSCAGGGLNILGKLRDRFKRGDACCDGGCASTSASTCSSGVTIPAKMGEKIDTAPKKMPVDPKADPKKKPQEVRIETQSAPFAPNVIQVTPSVPSVEITPVPAPRVEGDRRDPF